MRRITVECTDGHREEITIKADARIPRCKEDVGGSTEEKLEFHKACKKKREIVWVGGSAGFRVKGLTKRF